MLFSVSSVVIIRFSFFFLMIRRPPRSTQSRSSAASDVYKRQDMGIINDGKTVWFINKKQKEVQINDYVKGSSQGLSLIHISEPTRPY